MAQDDDHKEPQPTPTANESHRLRFVPLLFVALSVIALATACASDPEPRIEDFPSQLLGTWEQVGGPVGTLTFQGSTSSGIGRRSADGIAAETFTFQWVAPVIIRTDLAGNIEFTVLFENAGETLVLGTVSASALDEFIRYSRVR